MLQGKGQTNLSPNTVSSLNHAKQPNTDVIASSILSSRQHQSASHKPTYKPNDLTTPPPTKKPNPHPQPRRKHITNRSMANGWAPFIGLVVVVIFCFAAWFLAPKGENQTVWRSTLVLSAAAMYIMWAITFLAQLHPLISPVRGDLRPELNGGR